MKCLCNHCSTPLEFEEDRVGQTADCPECGLDTTLYKPAAAKPTESNADKLSDIGAKAAAAVGDSLQGADVAVRGVFSVIEVIVTVMVAVGLLVIGGYGAGMIGFLLALLVVVTASGLHDVRKEISKLNK